MSANIALVDDDRNILTSVSIAMQAEGYVTRIYSDGETALKALIENPADLGIFDIKMPRMDGLELLRVRPENHDGMSVTSHTFWYDDPWVSNDVLLTLLFHLSPAGRGLDTGVTEAGAPYWTFSPDHPGRMEAVGTLARQQFLSSPGNRG
jgi:hypothetical protein